MSPKHETEILLRAAEQPSGRLPQTETGGAFAPPAESPASESKVETTKRNSHPLRGTIAQEPAEGSPDFYKQAQRAGLQLPVDVLSPVGRMRRCRIRCSRDIYVVFVATQPMTPRQRQNGPWRAPRGVGQQHAATGVSLSRVNLRDHAAGHVVFVATRPMAPRQRQNGP